MMPRVILARSTHSRIALVYINIFEGARFVMRVHILSPIQRVDFEWLARLIF
jgi:hypothetical protein